MQTSDSVKQQDFLFELGLEELPARFQHDMWQDLHTALKARLSELGAVECDDSLQLVTPRRLAVKFKIPVTQQDRTVSLFGPPKAVAFDADGKPTKALEGFAKKNGLEPSDFVIKADGTVEKAFCEKVVKGRPTIELLPEMITSAVSKITLAKPMRWGAEKHLFIRPVHWVVALFGHEVVDVELFGVKSGRVTHGHRFHAPDAIEIEAANFYEILLRERGKVMPSIAERQRAIVEQVNALTTANGGVSVFGKPTFDGESWDRLLDEVAGLVEWPVAVLGEFESRFLAVPQECLISTMRDNQRYFHIVDGNGKLHNKFIVISNIESKRPVSIAEGNAKVIRPRFADAEFFFNTDKKTRLCDRRAGLANVVFQKELGTVANKAARVAELAASVANLLGGDGVKAMRAGELCKADLLTAMVNEFPELQGIMGEYYAKHDGEDSEVAQAIREHYLPRFSGDALPETLTGVCVAIADRVDTLVGIFGIGQAPTGAKDPFALRRAAIGLLRLCIEKKLQLDLAPVFAKAKALLGSRLTNANVEAEVYDFVFNRLRADYSEQGVMVEIFNAVMELKISHPLDFDRRINAVKHFNTLPEATALAAANKRVRNILAKSDVAGDELAVEEGALIEQAEIDLFKAIVSAKKDAAPLLLAGDYTATLVRLAALRAPVDVFFDKVMVNSPHEQVRRNRHALLRELQKLFGAVADISQLPG